jgi:hypothetical protein
MPLHYAVRNGREIAVGLLLAKGADPRFRDRRTGMTPAECALHLEYHDVAALLLFAVHNLYLFGVE